MATNSKIMSVLYTWNQASYYENIEKGQPNSKLKSYITDSHQYF